MILIFPGFLSCIIIQEPTENPNLVITTTGSWHKDTQSFDFESGTQTWDVKQCCDVIMPVFTTQLCN